MPLWIAFALGRRAPTRRFTHGYHRAEDLAGIAIVLAIAVSAGAVAWESIQWLTAPCALDNIPWLIGAGVIGALGNEWVARYRIRVGTRIGSEALVADGHHARADAYTSLSVVAAGAGAAIGWTWADPVAGLIVAGMILVILRRTAFAMGGRLLDAVDPALVEQAIRIAGEVEGVQAVTDLRLRFAGHRLLATVSIEVDPEATVAAGHEVSERVAHELAHRLPFALDDFIHADPAGVASSHDLTFHHRLRMEGRDPADHDRDGFGGVRVITIGFVARGFGGCADTTVQAFESPHSLESVVDRPQGGAEGWRRLVATLPVMCSNPYEVHQFANAVIGTGQRRHAQERRGCVAW